MKEETFPHTKNALHWWRQGGGREASEPRRKAQQWGAEGKPERFLHRGSLPTSTH